jgi:hypothetical protein
MIIRILVIIIAYTDGMPLVDEINMDSFMLVVKEQKMKLNR